MLKGFVLISTTVLERLKMGLKETEFNCEYLDEYMGSIKVRQFLEIIGIACSLRII